jgi:hypothetical protein
VRRNVGKILVNRRHEKRRLEELKGHWMVFNLLIPAFILYTPSVILYKFLVTDQRRMCDTLWLQSVMMARRTTCPLCKLFIYWCINSLVSGVSSPGDQSCPTWPGPYTVYRRDVWSTVSSFSLLSTALQEATNSYLDHTLTDNKFATCSAGKHETSAHPLNILYDTPPTGCTTLSCSKNC